MQNYEFTFFFYYIIMGMILLLITILKSGKAFHKVGTIKLFMLMCIFVLFYPIEIALSMKRK